MTTEVPFSDYKRLESKAGNLERQVLNLKNRIRELEKQDEIHWKTRRALLRGEFICRKCGLRKDGEKTDADF